MVLLDISSSNTTDVIVLSNLTVEADVLIHP